MPNAVAEPLKIAVVGLGEVGRAVAAAVLADAGLALAGLVDIDPSKTGKRLADLGIVTEHPATILADVEQLSDVDVAILCGGSHLDRVAPTLRQLMRLGVPVVSSCEEMTWPWMRHPHLGDVLAGEARKAGVAILGAGVYPAFGFDRRPLSLAMQTTGVKHVAVKRVIDLRTASPTLVRRAALGKSVAQFTAYAKQKLVGAVGLAEMVVLIAQGLNRHPTAGQIGMTVLPLMPGEAIDGPSGRIKPGQVSGLRQRAVYQDDGLDIELELTLTLDSHTAGDDIQIDANPPVQHIQAGNYPSPDAAPAAALIRAACQMKTLTPGLRTVLDLPATSPHQQEHA